MDFSPHVTFISGTNGSGKSAVLQVAVTGGGTGGACSVTYPLLLGVAVDFAVSVLLPLLWLLLQALQCCLGVKASQTGRAAKFSSFVRTGCDEAVVRVGECLVWWVVMWRLAWHASQTLIGLWELPVRVRGGANQPASSPRPISAGWTVVKQSCRSGSRCWTPTQLPCPPAQPPASLPASLPVWAARLPTQSCTTGPSRTGMPSSTRCLGTPLS